jgi:hypothetical protein
VKRPKRNVVLGARHGRAVGKEPRREEVRIPLMSPRRSDLMSPTIPD